MAQATYEDVTLILRRYEHSSATPWRSSTRSGPLGSEPDAMARIVITCGELPFECACTVGNAFSDHLRHNRPGAYETFSARVRRA